MLWNNYRRKWTSQIQIGIRRWFSQKNKIYEGASINFSNGFEAPGRLEDLSKKGKEKWNSTVLEWILSSSWEENKYQKIKRTHWFNPLERQPNNSLLQLAEVSWIGFPQKVKIESSTDEERWQKADSDRRFQDEYLEWGVTRNKDGKIIKVEFTCEGVDYWKALAEDNPKCILQLYRELINPQVQEEDIFHITKDNNRQEKKYIPINKWNNYNSTNVIHLIQKDNTLPAEIELAAAATIVRRDPKNPNSVLTDPQQLIRCSQYGVAARNSDPLIGASVNALSRAGAMITLANPIGLYIKDINTHGWTLPPITTTTTNATTTTNSSSINPQQFWQIQRGSQDLCLRATFSVPPSFGFTVGDIRLGSGDFIQYGSQLADFIRIKIFVAYFNSSFKPIPLFCKGDL